MHRSSDQGKQVSPELQAVRSEGVPVSRALAFIHFTFRSEQHLLSSHCGVLWPLVARKTGFLHQNGSRTGSQLPGSR